MGRSIVKKHANGLKGFHSSYLTSLALMFVVSLNGCGKAKHNVRKQPDPSIASTPTTDDSSDIETDVEGQGLPTATEPETTVNVPNPNLPNPVAVDPIDGSGSGKPKGGVVVVPQPNPGQVISNPNPYQTPTAGYPNPVQIDSDYPNVDTPIPAPVYPTLPSGPVLDPIDPIDLQPYVHHSNPSDFATRVYRGEFQEQFNSYQVFCSKWNANQYNVTEIVSRGIYSRIVDPAQANASYYNSVDDMLNLQCR